MVFTVVPFDREKENPPEAGGLVPEAPGSGSGRAGPSRVRPSAARAAVSTALIAVMEQSAFAGMVTALNSSQSHFTNRMPQVSLMSCVSMPRKPIDKPRTRPDLSDCHASSSLSFSLPGSAMLASLAVTVMPSLPTFASVTWPIGCFESCCQSKAIGSVNFAPSGSTTSCIRSGEGVVAIPVNVRDSSSTDLRVITE